MRRRAIVVLCFFFSSRRRHTRFDCDWSSDVCSSDLPLLDGGTGESGDATCETFDAPGEWAWTRGRYGAVTRTLVTGPAYVLDVVELRSEERRVGKECRSRWSPYH